MLKGTHQVTGPVWYEYHVDVMYASSSCGVYLVISSADEICWKPEEDNETTKTLSFASNCVPAIFTCLY